MDAPYMKIAHLHYRQVSHYARCCGEPRLVPTSRILNIVFSANNSNPAHSGPSASLSKIVWKIFSQPAAKFLAYTCLKFESLPPTVSQFNIARTKPVFKPYLVTS